MPPRKKPTSTRQKKADQQLKRAVKRGDAPPPDSTKKTAHRKPKSFRQGPTGQQIGSPNNMALVESAKRLQSAFIKLPPKFLEESKSLASTISLSRPISDEVAIFVDHDTLPSISPLTCPRRPKWRFDMTKVEVERNEEGLFKKWLEQTDHLVEQWKNQTDTAAPGGLEKTSTLRNPGMPSSPTYFERNLEVWRQLWRVTEISQIILVLLDSRCPILHYPPSLSAYLSDRKVILVLTKVDITGPVRVQAWIEHFQKNFPSLRIVQVESYVEKESTADHQGRRQYEPHIPDNFRERLIQAIREIHAEMLEPPEKVKNNPVWLNKWVPPVKQDIAWTGVLNAQGTKVGSAVGGVAVQRPKQGDDSENEGHEPEFLTIGVIGQPNVGKSSLLNALFGVRRVRASKTPGKTKHFQTLYWTPDVRLVDCPGLVMPNYVPMEMQVLCGILPISRVSAIPSCIYFASRLVPLEKVYKLIHPITWAPPAEDKRTWREGTKPDTDRDEAPSWTAIDILTAYADTKGWVTAKAGRPDVHRAGNAILRALAEGRISWGFLPPDTTPSRIKAEIEDSAGIWIPHDSIVDLEGEQDSEDDNPEEEGSEQSTENTEDDDEDEGEDEDEVRISTGAGRFGALMTQLNESNDKEDEDEDQDRSD